jgi:hypothetical protein
LHILGPSPSRHDNVLEAAASIAIGRTRLEAGAGRLGRPRREGSRQEHGDPCRCHGNGTRFIQHRNTLLDIREFSKHPREGSRAHAIGRLLFFYVGIDFISVSELSCEKNGRVLAEAHHILIRWQAAVAILGAPR